MTSTTLDARAVARFTVADNTRKVVEAARLIKVAAYALERARSAGTVLSRGRASESALPTRTVPASSNGSECPYAGLIRSVWHQDAEWAISIAMRESRCTPTARNASGSSGLFQLLLPLHDDLFGAVGCATAVPTPPGKRQQWTNVRWTDPECAVRAAWHLYEGAGRAPWRL